MSTRLVSGALIYAIGLVIHTADHFRRGTDVLSSHILWIGTASTLLGLVAVTLVVTRHRLGPLAAALMGIPTAIGVAAVHLLPRWSTAFSDAFPGGAAAGVAPLSWVAVLTEIAGALWMGMAGITLIRSQPIRPEPRHS